MQRLQILSGPAVEVPVGSYTITETDIPENFELTDLACTGGADVTTDVTSARASITLAADETVICTFKNTYILPMGTIQIVKQVRNAVTGETAPAANFSFVGSPELNAVLNGTGGEETISGPVVEVSAASSYIVWERDLENFEVTDLACTGGDVDINMAEAQLDIRLARDEAVVCTFTNTYLPPTQLIITKEFERPVGLNYVEFAAHFGHDATELGFESDTLRDFVDTNASARFAVLSSSQHQNVEVVTNSSNGVPSGSSAAITLDLSTRNTVYITERSVSPSYWVTITSLSGYTTDYRLTDRPVRASCTNSAGVEIPSRLSGRGLTVDAIPHQLIRCTIVNTGIAWGGTP